MATQPLQGTATQNPDGYSMNVPSNNPNVPVSAISPVSQMNIPVPQAVSPSVYTSAINTTASDLSIAQDNALKAQQAQDQANSESQGLSGIIAGLEGSHTKDVAGTYNSQGVNTLYNQLQDLNAQATGLKNEASAIPIQNALAYQGNAGVKGGVELTNRDQLAQNALKALSLGQQYAIAEGNYNKAKNYADQLIETKYAGEEARIKSLQTQQAAYDKYTLTPLEQKRLEAVKKATDLEAQQLADKKANDKEVSKLIIDASSVAPADVLQRAKDIQTKGGSPTEVAMALGQYGGDYLANEKLKLEMKKVKQAMETESLQQQKLRGEINAQGVATSQAQTPEVAAWVANINSGKAKLSDVPAKLKSAVSLGLSAGTSANPAKLQGYTDTLNLIKSITDSGALSSVVGPSALGRIGYTYNRAIGNVQDFTAKVQQLTEGLTLQALIDSKAKGATFGALSEGELSLLAKSATRLNSYKKVDDNSNIYYDVNESGFKSALKEIENYTQLAFEREGGSNFVTTGNAVADQFIKNSMGALNNASASTPATSAGYIDNQK